MSFKRDSRFSAFFKFMSSFIVLSAIIVLYRHLHFLNAFLCDYTCCHAEDYKTGVFFCVSHICSSSVLKYCIRCEQGSKQPENEVEMAVCASVCFNYKTTVYYQCNKRRDCSSLVPRLLSSFLSLGPRLGYSAIVQMHAAQRIVPHGLAAAIVEIV